MRGVDVLVILHVARLFAEIGLLPLLDEEEETLDGDPFGSGELSGNRFIISSILSRAAFFCL